MIFNWKLIRLINEADDGRLRSDTRKQYNLIYCSYICGLLRPFADDTGTIRFMTLALGPVALRPLAILLALMLLVLATVADAATCGTEAGFSERSEIAITSLQVEVHDENDQGNPNTPVEQHGACAHGHCHHGSNVESAVVDVESLEPLAAHLSARYARLPSVDREIVSPPPRV